MSMMSKYLKEKQRAEADKVIRDTVIREFDKLCDRANVVILYYTDEELEAVVMEYINDRDDFAIEYDEETDTETVLF